MTAMIPHEWRVPHTMFMCQSRPLPYLPPEVRPQHQWHPMPYFQNPITASIGQSKTPFKSIVVNFPSIQRPSSDPSAHKSPSPDPGLLARSPSNVYGSTSPSIGPKDVTDWILPLMSRPPSDHLATFDSEKKNRVPSLKGDSRKPLT